MEEYEKIEETIGNKPINVLIDNDGVKWYPLKHLLRKILFKKDGLERYRDTYAIKYMRPIKHFATGNGNNRYLKAWFINESGVKYILKNMKVLYKNNPAIYNMQSKALIEACMHFKVNTDEREKPKFINQTPILEEYDIWSKVCIESDMNLSFKSKWMLCDECGYYYPLTTKYFLKGICRQCAGKDFKSPNPILQYIKEKGGINLLYALDMKDDTNIVKELNNFINSGGKNGS